MSLSSLLVCSSEYPPHYSSGIGNVAYNLVDIFKDKGIDCAVCSPNGPDIKLGSSKIIDCTGILGLIYYWNQAGRYIKRHADEYDAIWIHNPILLDCSSIRNCLITIHTTYYGYMSKNFYPRCYYYIASLIERKYLNSIRELKFVGVDKEVCKELSLLGLNQISYIPNGVNTTKFRPYNQKIFIRSELGIPEDDVILLSLGRLDEQKQPLKLIELFSKIEHSTKNITLIIAGKGKLLQDVKEYINTNDIKNIIVLGYVSEKDVPRIYGCSDYYILSSKYEGQPLTLLEAISSGLPCIISNIPNLNVVREADCGISIDFDDINKSANAVSTYLMKDNKNHSINARSYAIGNLDWNIIAEKYLELFEYAVD